MRINIFQTASLIVNNLPHPLKIKRFKQELSYVKPSKKEKENYNLFSQRNPSNVKQLQGILAGIILNSEMKSATLRSTSKEAKRNANCSTSISSLLLAVMTSFLLYAFKKHRAEAASVKLSCIL